LFNIDNWVSFPYLSTLSTFANEVPSISPERNARMKPTIVHILLCSSIFIGCKNDDPVGSGTTPALPAPVSAIIGTAGGTLTTKGFSLTVPPAAFIFAETLTVAAETYDNAFGARVFTGVFKLEGLPAFFAKSLEVKLECSRTPSAGYYIALGREVASPGSGESGIFYSPYTAAKDSTFLRATLLSDSLWQGRTSLRKSTRSEGLGARVAWLLGVDEQAILMSHFGHFKIFYPRYVETMASNLAAALENAYAAFFQMGFDRTAYDQVPWPMLIDVRKVRFASPLPPADLWAGHMPGLGEFFMGIEFEEEALVAGDLPIIQRAAGQVFSNLFFMLNDPLFQGRFDAQMLQVDRNRIWPYYAIGAWAGEVFAPLGTGGDAPLNFRLQQMCPFDGLTVGSTEKPWAHGLGLSPLIRYIAITYTPDLVFQLYYKIPHVGSAIDALQAILPVPEKEWWPDFLKEYISGKIYNVTSDDLLKDLSSPLNSRIFTIQGPTDTLKTFSDTYADLSARLYRVNLRYSGLDTSALIRFSAGPASLGSQYVGVMLFGLKNKTLTYWQFANTVTVKQVKDLTASGYDIVAAVVNCLNESPYNGSRAIELTVTVESGPGEIPLQAALIAKIGGTYTNSSLNTLHAYVSYFSPVSDTRNGILSGHTFTASWNRPLSVSTNRTARGNLVLSFDDSSPPHLIAFALRDTITGSGVSQTFGLTSSTDCNIPGRLDYILYVFEVTGTATRNQIGTLEYLYAKDDGYWERFVSFEPGAGDLISITVQKW
jgi:hypothetical protein